HDMPLPPVEVRANLLTVHPQKLAHRLLVGRMADRAQCILSYRVVRQPRRRRLLEARANTTYLLECVLEGQDTRTRRRQERAVDVPEEGGSNTHAGTGIRSISAFRARSSIDPASAIAFSSERLTRT